MAMAKRSQGNPWVLTSGVFIVLFVFAVVAAIVFYLNAEKKSRTIEDLQQQTQEMASNKEWTSRSALIGAKSSRDTYFGTSIKLLDDMVYTILGAPRKEDSAEVKIQTVNNQINDFMAMVSRTYSDIGTVDVNTVGLLGTMGRLKNKLDSSVMYTVDLEKQVENEEDLRQQIQDKADEDVKKLTDEKSMLGEQARQVQASYDKLKNLMEQSTDEQVQLLASDLEAANQKLEETNQEFLKAKAELQVTKDRLKDKSDQLAKMTGQPATGPQARLADGEIVLLDEVSKIVHIDLGSKDKVYPGLTFSVYNRSVPIPDDGKGKAEVEVFSVSDNISTARIVSSNPRDPILVSDIVANLIWSRDKVNRFVVAGDFDIDFDMVNDYQADKKVTALIENWGGMVESKVSVNTNFVVVGNPPLVKKRPTYDELSVDPLAMEKYEASLRKLANYREALEQARDLNIPILNYETFLYFIGYKTQSTRPGAFDN